MTRYLARSVTEHSDDTIPLFCFPYAGGGASAFGRWQRSLDAHGAGVTVVPIQLPGREGRIGEPRFTDLWALVEDMDDQLDDVLCRPHLFYGHSMGALLAYSLAWRRQQRGAPLPLAVALSAYRAPHLPAPRIAEPGASDEELIASLAALGGIPQVLLNHPDFLSALLPVARDDLMLCTGYTASRHRAAARAAAPVRGAPRPAGDRAGGAVLAPARGTRLRGPHHAGRALLRPRPRGRVPARTRRDDTAVRARARRRLNRPRPPAPGPGMTDSR
ncbi:thioesterase II family protein [Streptomyces thermocoprophilus]|uniref:thioesterase II family protein n=1 Tax=Streptomyces thermocoprophilus TaxID=78356 RepID=UPI00360616D2